MNRVLGVTIFDDLRSARVCGFFFQLVIKGGSQCGQGQQQRQQRQQQELQGIHDQGHGYPLKLLRSTGLVRRLVIKLFEGDHDQTWITRPIFEPTRLATWASRSSYLLCHSSLSRSKRSARSAMAVLCLFLSGVSPLVGCERTILPVSSAARQSYQSKPEALHLYQETQQQGHHQQPQHDEQHWQTRRSKTARASDIARGNTHLRYV